jgi:D-serine deaminase-like pyridoxal phosphate-dependent protein
MVGGGIEDILITNQVVTKDKIVRLCGLARQADVKVAVDDRRNLRDLSSAAVDSGATLGIVIEVDTSMSRAGVRTAEEGVELARLAVELPGLVFRGVMSHQTLGGRSGDLETRKRVGEKFIQMCLDVRNAIEEAGIPVEIVSSGETFTYDVAAGMLGVTEVQGGTYVLMTHRSVLGDVFKVAMKVLASVVSAPRPGVAIGDVGYRAISSSASVVHAVEDLPEVRVDSLQEDHVVLRSEGPMPLAAGDRFVLLPGVQDGTVNRWDQYIAVRDGIVEAVWDIPGRGRFN